MRIVGLACVLCALTNIALLIHPYVKGEGSAKGDGDQHKARKMALAINQQQSNNQARTTNGAETNKTNQPAPSKVVVTSSIWQDVGAVAVAGFTAALVYFSWRGWQVAKISADAAYSAVQLADRPWIDLSFKVKDDAVFFLPDDELFLTIVPAINNIGKSPAVAVEIIHKAFIANPEHVRSGEAIRSVRDSLTRNRADARDFVLFPNATPDSRPINVNFSSNEVRAAIDPPGDVGHFLYIRPVVIIGAIFYRFGDLRDDHVTRVVCVVSDRDGLGHIRRRRLADVLANNPESFESPVMAKTIPDFTYAD